MLQEDRPDFVLNLCDEGFHNDPFKEMHVAAALEMFGVPYSGAAPRALGLCYDKALVRAVAHSLDIPVPLESFFAADDQMATLPSVFPARVKPNLGDSSQGITQDAVVHNKEQFIAYWERLRAEFPDRPLLVQEFLSGNEYSVGVIGNPGSDFLVLPVLEWITRGSTPRCRASSATSRSGSRIRPTGTTYATRWPPRCGGEATDRR